MGARWAFGNASRKCKAACAAAPRFLKTLARAGSPRAASGRFLKTLGSKLVLLTGTSSRLLSRLGLAPDHVARCIHYFFWFSRPVVAALHQG